MKNLAKIIWEWLTTIPPTGREEILPEVEPEVSFEDHISSARSCEQLMQLAIEHKERNLP